MSFTAIAWVLLLVLLCFLSLRRPAWAVGIYMQTFFALPDLWWWGKSTLGGQRWSMFGGLALLVAVLMRKFREADLAPAEAQPKVPMPLVGKLALAMLANATFVHFLLADDRVASEGPYTLLAKFVLLFFLISAAVRDRSDYHIVIISIVLGATYIGYEVTINDRGSIEAGRLEGVGAPGAFMANELACLMVTVLPFLAGLFFMGKKRLKLLVAISGPLVLNVILLCNSRGAFLALIAGIVFLVALTRGKARKHLIWGLALGSLSLSFLLKDPEILERFLTTFSSKEERDSSASGRLIFWEAGLRMIGDYPLGEGGNAFKKVHGSTYLAELGVLVDRNVHNGYINEACEWGIQGAILRILFYLGVLSTALKMARYRMRNNDPGGALMCLCLFSSVCSFLVASIFGSYLDAEWGIWVAALAMSFRRVYGPSPQALPGSAALASPESALLAPLPAS